MWILFPPESRWKEPDFFFQRTPETTGNVAGMRSQDSQFYRDLGIICKIKFFVLQQHVWCWQLCKHNDRNSPTFFKPHSLRQHSRAKEITSQSSQQNGDPNTNLLHHSLNACSCGPSRSRSCPAMGRTTILGAGAEHRLPRSSPRRRRVSAAHALPAQAESLVLPSSGC